MPTITPAVLAGELAAATHPLSEPYALRPGVLATLWQRSQWLIRIACAYLGGRRASSDEVRLIDQGCGLTAGDADEDASVHPVEIGDGGLDLG